MDLNRQLRQNHQEVGEECILSDKIHALQMEVTLRWMFFFHVFKYDLR